MVSPESTLIFPKETQPIWIDIPGYEGFYQVSDHGRIRRLLKYFNYEKTRFLRSSPLVEGYRKVSLSKRGIVRQFLVHRLVMLAFIGEPGEKQVNHRNGFKWDNRLENLEYCTPSENILHSYQKGLKERPYGRMNPNAKLTEEDIYLVWIGWLHARLDLGGIKGIARYLNLPYSTVYYVIHERHERNR